MLSALASLLGAVLRFVLFLVMVAVLAVGGTLAYQRWWPGAQPAVPASALASTPCVFCQGSGQVRCSVCGGAGRVDSMQVHTPCDQCGGTGMYQHKMKKSFTRCPFCRGTGVKDSYRARTACASCEGKGFTACATCGGTGRTQTTPDTPP